MSSAVSPVNMRRQTHEGGVEPSPPKVPPPRPPPGGPKPKPSPAGMLFSRSQTPSRSSEAPVPVTPQESLTPRGTVRKLLTPFGRSSAAVFTLPLDPETVPEQRVQSPTVRRSASGSTKVMPSSTSSQQRPSSNGEANRLEFQPGQASAKPVVSTNAEGSSLKAVSSRTQLSATRVVPSPASTTTSSAAGMYHELAEAARRVVISKTKIEGSVKETETADFSLVVDGAKTISQAGKRAPANETEWETVSPPSKYSSAKRLDPALMAKNTSADSVATNQGLHIETRTPEMSMLKSEKGISSCFDEYDTRKEVHRPLDLSSMSPQKTSATKSPVPRSPSRNARGSSLESEVSDSSGLASRKTSTESESLRSLGTADALSRKSSSSSERTLLSKTGSSSSLLDVSSASPQQRRASGSKLPPPPPARQAAKVVRDKYSLTDFELGVTLGTGSFGRVRFASFRSPLPGTAESKTRIAIKILRKDAVRRLNQVDHIRHEKSILQSLATLKDARPGSEDEPWVPSGRHPFIVQLFGTFQTQTCLFMVMEFIRGGEFFCHLRMRGHFKNHEATFYTASVASVFAFLHDRDIAYRDLKPENLMLDHEGHLKVVDFGFAKHIPDNKTFTLCGTPEYIAPEVLLNKGHGMGVDWWALGILTYEMLSGVAPFTDSDPMVIYQRIVRGNVQYPTYFDPDARSFLRRLLQVDLSKRYGCLANGARDVVEHRWLSGIDFDGLLRRTVQPPVVPETKDMDDTSCFEEYPEGKDLDLEGLDGQTYTEGGDFPNFDAVCM